VAASSRHPVNAQLLRRLLAQPGSYPIIAAAVESGGLPQFPVALFDHVGDVYRRVETAAGGDFEHVEALRLTTLVHEEPLESLPQLLASAGVSELLPEVVAVTREFGRVWRVRTDDDLRGYVEKSRPYLAAILLFEFAHEGQSTPQMERAAQAGRLETAFARWAARLAGATPWDATRRRAATGRLEPSSDRGGLRPRF
jgi:hypothetical protein